MLENVYHDKTESTHVNCSSRFENRWLNIPVVDWMVGIYRPQKSCIPSKSGKQQSPWDIYDQRKAGATGFEFFRLNRVEQVGLVKETEWRWPSIALFTNELCNCSTIRLKRKNLYAQSCASPTHFVRNYILIAE